MTVTTIIRNPQKAGLPSVFNGFAIIQKRREISSKIVQSLKMQHFIRMRLKTPTVDIAPVKLYPYVKKQDANSCIWVCVLLLPVPTVPPWHIVYLWGETVETSGLFAASSFWVQLDVFSLHYCQSGSPALWHHRSGFFSTRELPVHINLRESETWSWPARNVRWSCFSALLQTRFSPRFSIFCISVKVHSPLLRQQIRARRIYGHWPSCGYQLHCIVGGGSGCGRSGGAWKRGRQYSSCLCFIKSLPERKKSRDF